MPLLDPSQLRGTAFLYPTDTSATANLKTGGTGFIVGRRNTLVPDNWIPYMISNRHVVNVAPVARFNRKDGSMALLSFKTSDWVAHPTADLAAVCIYGIGEWTREDTTFTAEEDFITKEKIDRWKIGPGDEVFMVGRFINHQGNNSTIRPAARFGSICMMQESIQNPALKHAEESFAVEMRSRTGFSGSPVMVYRSGATNISMFHPIDFFHGLLGVNWATFSILKHEKIVG